MKLSMSISHLYFFLCERIFSYLILVLFWGVGLFIIFLLIYKNLHKKEICFSLECIGNIFFYFVLSTHFVVCLANIKKVFKVYVSNYIFFLPCFQDLGLFLGYSPIFPFNIYCFTFYN